MTARILLNALALRPQGSGVQTYIRQLMRELVHDDGIRFEALVQSDAAGGVPPGIIALRAPQVSGVRRAAYGWSPRRNIDLVHGLNVALPVSPGTPKVVTVHDMVQFDLPVALPRSKALASRLHLRSAVQRADVVIADSAFTAERVQQICGRTAIHVPLAPGPEFTPSSAPAVASVRERHRLPERFVLHVGTIGPRKDVPTLAAACRQARVPLVLVGAGRAPGADGVTALGWVDDADLPALYGAATLVGYPTLYEGFGLPPLEAMACGAPVIASDIPPLRENLTGAAELVRPRRVDAWAERIQALAADADRRSELRRAGLARARSFSWARTAEQTLDVYRSLGIAVRVSATPTPGSTGSPHPGVADPGRITS